MRERSPVRRLVLCALLASGALVLSFVGSLFPLPLPLPGARLGRGSAMLLLPLLLFGLREAAGVLATKVLLSALLLGTPLSLAYAAVGRALSLSAMAPVGESGVSLYVAPGPLSAGSHSSVSFRI